jgi:hypothetical protein
MSKDILRVETKLDKLLDDVVEIKVTLAHNTASLDEHIRRTNILEKQVEPIKNHVTMFTGVIKAMGVASLILGVIYVCFQIAEFIK